VRHGDRPDRARSERLPQLPDLGPLKLVDLIADLAGRSGDRREQPDELGDPVQRTPGNSTPTSFRQWCEEVLKPAVLDQAEATAS